MPETNEKTQGTTEIVSFHQPERDDHPFVLVREKREHERSEAVFAVDLAGVVFGKNREDSGKQKDGGKPPRILESVINTMAPGGSVEFVYTGARHRPFAWRIFGSVEGRDPDVALANARRLYESIALGIRAEGADFRFTPVREAKVFQRSHDMAWQARIVPNALTFKTRSTQTMGFHVRGKDGLDNHGLVHLPRLACNIPILFNRLPLVLRQSSAPVEIRCRVARVHLSEQALKQVGAALEWLQNGKEKRVRLNEDIDVSVTNQPLIDEACRLLAAWLHTKSGCRLSVEVLSGEPIPSSLLGVVIEDLFHGQSAEVMAHRGFSTDKGHTPPTGRVLDLHDCIPSGYPLPPVFPDTEHLNETETQRIYNRRLSRLPGKGILLGNVIDGTHNEEVRFNNRDRSRHTYVIGATGTGKSTLLANMIIQDIENNEGVTVIDPHGDLYAQVLASVPSYREKDLILIDPGDSKRSVGINLLECGGPRREAEMHFAINEMMKIFARLYDRQTMGPQFETYMRTAMLTLMDQDPPSEATLLDIPRFFQDSAFRKRKKALCKNAMAVEFWTETAERSSGDQSLPNFAGYIISKLNMFVYNRLMRNIVGQIKSTLDFRQAIDTRKVILVNLAKGELGQLDSQFLGMLIIGKLFGAALSRSTQRSQSRVPHYLYIDEFQNFTTDTVAYMMGEARKFELRLTLANQNLSQLAHHEDRSDLNITEAVLGNIGTFLCFRVGTPDAQKLDAYTKPEFNGQDLQYLPDYHVVAKLLANNAPTRPFVFQTVPSLERTPSRTLVKAITRAKLRYTLPVRDVEKSILARREDSKESSSSF